MDSGLGALRRPGMTAEGFGGPRFRASRNDNGGVSGAMLRIALE
jgi:hypothetical protein